MRGHSLNRVIPLQYSASWICPDCGKRARPMQDAFFCDEHNKVQPVNSYLINAVLDDGSIQK